jgi:hypothetical protein
MKIAPKSYSTDNRAHRWLYRSTSAILVTLATSMSAQGDTPTRPSLSPATENIHLYGETAQPDVIGKEYMVFETTGNKTVGAFYLPQSEFSCFYGRFQGTRLNLTLIDSYDRQQYSLTLRLNSGNGLTASRQPHMGEPTYQPIGKLGSFDRQVIATCKQQLQENQY